MWLKTQTGALLNMANVSAIGLTIASASTVVAYDVTGGDRDEIRIGKFDSPEIAAAVLEKLADMLGAVSVTAIASAAAPAASEHTG